MAQDAGSAREKAAIYLERNIGFLAEPAGFLELRHGIGLI